MITWKEFIKEVNASHEEERLLVFHLASYRARKTLEKLMPEEPKQDASYIIAKFNANDDE